MKKKIIIGLVLVLVLIQFIRVDKTNPPIDSSKDFVTLVKAPVEIVSLLEKACYDCHSNKTTYPWYFNVAPIAWWAKDHVNDGRKHLNFSVWGDYKDERKADKLDEMLGEIDQSEMPLSSYTLMHEEAKLTADERVTLVNWLRTIR